MMQIFEWEKFGNENNIDTTLLNDIVSRLPFLNENTYIAGGAIADIMFISYRDSNNKQL